MLSSDVRSCGCSAQATIAFVGAPVSAHKASLQAAKLRAISGSVRLLISLSASGGSLLEVGDGSDE